MTFRDRIRGLARLPGARIEPAPLNPRTHDDRQRGAMRGLLTELGVIAAGVVWVPDAGARKALRKVDGAEAFAAWLAGFGGAAQLIDGHLRREELAAQDVPVIVTDLDKREAALALATFDPVGELAGRDLDRLRTLLSEVTAQEAGTVDLLAGLRRLVPGPRSEDDEEEPVIPTDALVKKWGTASGQLWVVPSITVPGREHRLLCGDCRDPANVKLLSEGARPALGLHDGPYGISAVGTALARVRHGRNKRLAVGAVSNRQRGGKAHKTAFAPVHDDDKAFDPSHLLTASEITVLWGANHFADRLPPSAEWVVWVKLTDDAGESNFSSAELAWVTPPKDRKGHVRRVTVLRGMGTVDGAPRLHPTQKPEKAQRAPIEWYSKPGDLVADWYMGAGAVIIACEQTGRIGHGMDIAPAYLAATLERLAARGLTPRLVS